jgi:NAD-dependent DNA ligase
MKALAEWDAEELKRLKKTGTIIADEVIEVFEEIKIKNIAKILEASDIENLLKSILKAFARLT